MTEASKLHLLAELAAAKGQSDLAEDIRVAARILVGGGTPITDRPAPRDPVGYRPHHPR